jgi:anti-sigma regulatory factor (Ser/Thr protein kinase)
MTQRTWELPFSKAAAWEARRHVAQTLNDRQVDAGTVEVACLLISEIVANAVLHGDSPLTMTIAERAGGWQLRVHDASEDYPSIRRSSPEREGGRGLMLVETLALAWGADSAPDGGKDVWFSL